MIVLPVGGVDKGQKTEEDKIVQFDLSKALDLGTPANLSGALGEFAGKIQQTCNGLLIQSTYELYVIAEIDGCICCDQPPSVFTPIEVLAPQKVIAFFMAMPAMVSEDGPHVEGYQAAYDANQAPAPYPQPTAGYPGQPEIQMTNVAHQEAPSKPKKKKKHDSSSSDEGNM